MWLSSVEEKERRHLRSSVGSDTTSEYSLINIEVPQFGRLVKKYSSQHRANNAIQTLDFSIRSGMVGTRALMQGLDLFKILLHNTSPQVFTTVGEDFLWCTIMQVDFIVNELGNNILRRSRDLFSDRPASSIVNCCDNPSIPIYRSWQPSDEVN